MSRRSKLRGLMLAFAIAFPVAFAACSPSGGGGGGATDGPQGSTNPSMLDSSPGSSDGMTTESESPAAS